MPSLNLPLELLDHPKIKRLRRELRNREAEAFLFRIWKLAGQQYPDDGIFIGLSAAEIEDEAGWRGAEGKLVSTLVRVGLMSMVTDNFALPGWRDEQGHLAAFRERARTAAKARWNKGGGNVPGPSSNDASSIPQAMLESGAGNAPTCNAFPALPAIHNQQHQPRSAADVVDDVVEQNVEDKDMARAELEFNGIIGRPLEELASIPGLTPAHVAAIAFEARAAFPDASGAGPIVNRLRGLADALPELIELKTAAALTNVGAVASIAGHAPVARAVFNDGSHAPALGLQTANGLIKFRPDQLAPRDFVMRPVTERRAFG